MSHSTFVWNRIAVSKQFGNHHVEITTLPENNPNSNLKLSELKKDASLYLKNYYVECHPFLWEGATLNDKPIVKMLAYTGRIGNYVTSLTYIVYTRNE